MIFGSGNLDRRPDGGKSGNTNEVAVPIESISNRARDSAPKMEKYQLRTLFKTAGSSSHFIR